MNQISRCMVTSFVLAAASLSAVTIANAVPPLPQTQANASYPDAPRKVEDLRLLPSEDLEDWSEPRSREEFGRGHFAPIVGDLRDTQALKSGERTHGSLAEKAKKIKKTKKTKRPGTPELPTGPGWREHPGRNFGDMPISNDPIDHPYAKRGRGLGIPREAIEVQEPSASALFLIGMLGILIASRGRKTR